VTGAGSKAAKKGGGGTRLAAFHPNLFTYNMTSDGSDGGGDGVIPAAAVPSMVPESYVALGRACVSEDPLARPTFDDIVRELERVSRDAQEIIIAASSEGHVDAIAPPSSTVTPAPSLSGQERSLRENQASLLADNGARGHSLVVNNDVFEDLADDRCREGCHGHDDEEREKEEMV
jgi:hypothetical protein